MENRELKEYLAEFADNAPVSIIMANPKKRKLYIPEELFMLRDEKNRTTGALHPDRRRKRDEGG
jgi:hypothetical protein